MTQFFSLTLCEYKYCIVSGELDLEVKETEHECLGVISKPANGEDVLKIFKAAGVISE